MAAALAVVVVAVGLGALPEAAGAAGAAKLPHPLPSPTVATPPAGAVPETVDGTADDADGTTDPSTDPAALPPLPMAGDPSPLTAANGFETVTDPRPAPQDFEPYSAPGPAVQPQARGASSSTATVHGTVTTDGTPWVDPGYVTVQAIRSDGQGGYDLGTLSALGDYTAPVPSGSYSITVYYQGLGNLLAPAPVTMVLTAGGDYTVDVILTRGGTISGSVSAEVGGAFALPNVTPIAMSGDVGTVILDHVVYGPGTSYQVFGLPEGDYQLNFDSSAQPSPVNWEYWQDERDPSAADIIHVGPGEAITGIDAVLQNVNTLRGVVRTKDAHGDLVPAANVSVQVVGWDDRGVWTDENGAYDIHGFSDGTYSLRFLASRVSPAWGTIVTEPFTFDQGGSVVVRDAVVEPGGAISGDITVAPTKGSTTQPGVGMQAQASILVPETGEYRFVASADGPGYRIPNLGAGQYLLRFVDPTHYVYRNEYYDDSLYKSDATLVTVKSGQTTSGISARLDSWTVHTYRYGGADRYEVAANLTHDAFAPGVPVLYIASGEKFSDALSAGPAAARQNGALLLVSRDTIPTVTRAAIIDLKPEKIVVVGGQATVSDAVYSQLKKLQPDITRIGGADRFEVSRNVIDYAFCGGPAGDCTSGAKTVFLATGANFPDALSAGPAAAHVDGAVLLVQGSSNEVDSETSTFLERLGTSKIYIAGGPASVSDGIRISLEAAHPGAVTRLSGEDRYEASAAINGAIFQKGETAFMASGAVFADALSGGPAAATVDAPLYLVRYDCLPNQVWGTIYYYDPVDLILLGGPNTLSDSVLHLEWLCS